MKWGKKISLRENKDKQTTCHVLWYMFQMLEAMEYGSQIYRGEIFSRKATRREKVELFSWKYKF